MCAVKTLATEMDRTSLGIWVQMYDKIADKAWATLASSDELRLCSTWPSEWASEDQPSPMLDHRQLHRQGKQPNASSGLLWQQKDDQEAPE